MQDKDFYLYVDGVRVKVSEEIYLEWRRSEDRERYFMKTLKQGRVIVDGENMSVKYIPSREVSYEEYLDAQTDTASPDGSMDDLMVKAQLMEKLEDALHILTEKEMELIQELFFLEKSEREAAGLFHVSQNTIHYRKNRVLEKLKKELFKFF